MGFPSLLLPSSMNADTPRGKIICVIINAHTSTKISEIADELDYAFVSDPETWKKVLGAQGRRLLVEYFQEVVSFYESQCDADNHAVREAACQSLAEVATRIDEEVVKPEVGRIIGALLVCFKDESWPVRDCACTASASITKQFPTAVEEAGRLPELVELWTVHIADNIPSVRENSAIALAVAASAYPKAHLLCGLDAVVATCRRLLLSVKNQSQDSSRYGALGQSSQYGAAHKLARDNDEALHTGQTMYSCGSLAPKLRKGGGCMDHGFTRHKEPWEESDGALRLWRRLCDVSPQVGAELIPEVVELANLNMHFAHAPYLLETLWRQVDAALDVLDPDVAAELATAMLPAMEISLTSGHKLTEAAAKSAARSGKRHMTPKASTATVINP